jgi:IPTL-CTERM motif
MKNFHSYVAAAALSLGLIAVPEANAAVTFSLSAGATCGNAASASFSPGGTVQVSLCATATADPICGVTVKFLAGVASQSEFQVTAREAATGAFPDVATGDAALFAAEPNLLNDIANPAATSADLGGLVAANATAAAGTFRVATYTLTARATATANQYTFSTAPLSYSIPATTCATPDDGPAVSAVTFTLDKAVVPNSNLVWSTTPSVTVIENTAASNNVSVSCTGTLNNPVTVTPTLGALNAGNYTISPASLVFNTCAAQTFTVSPRANNATFDAAVTGGVTYGLSSNVGVTTAPPATVVTVNDDEVAPVFTVSKLTASVSEGAAPTNDTFNVVCTGAMPTGVSPITVSVTQTAGSASATAGVDYTLTGSPASFTACAGATQAINLTPRNNNGTNDGSKTATLTLGTPSAGSLGTNRAVALTIADDDGPFAVSVVANPGCAEPTTNCSFSVTRSGGNVANALTVPITIGGTGVRGATTTTGDYYIGAAACGSVGTASGDVSVTFNANEANSVVKTINVCTVDNTVLNSAARSVTALVAAPGARTDYTQSSTTPAQVTIADDEAVVNAVAGATGTATSGSVPEGNVVRFSVSCPTLTTLATFNYTITPALSGADVFAGGAATGIVTCPAAAASNVAIATTITTDNDTTIGNNRSYTMTLSPETAMLAKVGVLATVIGNASATVNVLDDDVPKSIPTMGAFGLGLMSLLLVGIAGFVQRRRTK